MANDTEYFGVITKSEATFSANSKYTTQINTILRQMNDLIREKYEGHSLTLTVQGKRLPDSMIKAIESQMTVSGWTVRYEPPGSDQRDDWPGQFTIS